MQKVKSVMKEGSVRGELSRSCEIPFFGYLGKRYLGLASYTNSAVKEVTKIAHKTYLPA